MIVLHDPYGTLCIWYSDRTLKVLNDSLYNQRHITMSTCVWFVPGTITDEGTTKDAHS